ncbi:MAG: NAD(P)-binding protein [Kofleriaceae bacterium]
MTAAGRHAIVVGAGIAGLAVARALADRFERVTVIERDAALSPRPHVPHQSHTHILGARGYRSLCRQFPGLEGDLAAAGAPRFDFGECPFHAGSWAPRISTGLVSRSCTRALLERLLRARLVTVPNVELLAGHRTTGFVLVGDRVIAVELAGGRAIEADLVVDAAGMGSKTSDWLAGHGFPVPGKTEIDLDGAAVSQLFRPRPGVGDDWIVLFVRRGNGNFRHGAISRVEDGLWRVSVWGVAGLRPPRKLPELLAFARALGTPVFAELLEGATPVSQPNVYGNSWSKWVHYERLQRFPDGLVVVGDATFHPNYEHGQGMTFCAMTADLIARHLDHHALAARTGWSLRFQQALGAMNAPWWDWNLAVETVVPGVASPAASRTTQLRHRYFRKLRQAAACDPKLWKAVLEVNQAVRLPSALMHPAFALRVMRHHARSLLPQRQGSRALVGAFED